jgi:hypothetical protein
MQINTVEPAFALRSRAPSLVRPVVSRLVDRVSLCRPFGEKHRRGLFIYFDNNISVSQVYPFAYYSTQIQDEFDLEFRFTSFDDFLSADTKQIEGAEVVFLQTWYDVGPDALEQTFEQIRKLHPDAKIYFLDSFAPTHLHLARWLQPHIHGYIKKHLLKDRSSYARPTMGDTNLEEYYGDLFGIPREPVDWQVPPGFADKVIIGPGFFTAPHFLRAFLNPMTPSNDQPIDLHARFATGGTPWYSAMRASAQQVVDSMTELKVATGAGLPKSQYWREMRASKACFSPFGYGEVCWRDIEAMLTGTVLIKPDMGHLDVQPAVFIPGETYIPVRWDFADLPEKAALVANDAELRRHITHTAYQTIQDYLRTDGFVTQMRQCLDNHVTA